MEDIRALRQCLVKLEEALLCLPADWDIEKTMNMEGEIYGARDAVFTQLRRLEKTRLRERSNHNDEQN